MKNFLITLTLLLCVFSCKDKSSETPNSSDGGGTGDSTEIQNTSSAAATPLLDKMSGWKEVPVGMYRVSLVNKKVIDKIDGDFNEYVEFSSTRVFVFKDYFIGLSHDRSFVNQINDEQFPITFKTLEDGFKIIAPEQKIDSYEIIRDKSLDSFFEMILAGKGDQIRPGDLGFLDEARLLMFSLYVKNDKMLKKFDEAGLLSAYNSMFRYKIKLFSEGFAWPEGEKLLEESKKDIKKAIAYFSKENKQVKSAAGVSKKNSFGVEEGIYNFEPLSLNAEQWEKMKYLEMNDLMKLRTSVGVVVGEYMVLCEIDDYEGAYKFIKVEDKLYLHPVQIPFDQEDAITVNINKGSLHFEASMEHSLILHKATSMEDHLIKSKKGSLKSFDLYTIPVQYQLVLLADLILRKQISCIKALMKDIPIKDITSLNNLKPCEGVKDVIKALGGK